MNPLLDAIECLYDTIAEIENQNTAVAIRKHLVKLLHGNEFELSIENNKHPYNLYAEIDNKMRNIRNLKRNLRRMIEPEDTLRRAIDYMFENADHKCYEAMCEVIDKYARYSLAYRDISYDSDSS